MVIAEFATRAMLEKAIAVQILFSTPTGRLQAERQIELALADGTVVSHSLTDVNHSTRGALQAIFSSPTVKVLYNAKPQLSYLLSLGIEVKPLFDIMLAAQMLYMPREARSFDLATLAAKYLSKELSLAQEGSAEYPLDCLLRLRAVMIPHLRQSGLVDIAKIEFDCLRALAQIEYRGIYLDREKWQSLHRQTCAEQESAREALHIYSGEPQAQMTIWGEETSMEEHFGSQSYMLSLLQEHGIAVKGTAKQDLYPYREHPLVQALGDYRRATKLISAFLEPIAKMIRPDTGRLYPKYEQLIAYSGRMSCRDPNIQQIPRRSDFRACFSAPAGRCLVIADYSQIELRVVAQLTSDARMLAAYRNGEDLHTLTASILADKSMNEISKGERQAAKPVNFGLVYGMGPRGLQESARLTYSVEMTLEQAEQFSRRFFAAYSGIHRWHEHLKAHPGKEGRTLTGRRFAYTRSATLPELSNLPVQGTAADIVKRALGLLIDRLPPDVWIIAVIHDEILLECPEALSRTAASILKESMEEAAHEILSSVPALVEVAVAANWAG